MVSATWDDALTRLVVEDRTEFFGTYCMKFLSLSDGVALEDARKSGDPSRPSAIDDPGVASALDEITLDTGAGQDDVVDRLTGTQHALDLKGNRPDDGQGISRPMGWIGDDAVEPDAEPTRDDTKPQRKRGKSGNAPKVPKATTGEAPAAPSKPAIIY